MTSKAQSKSASNHRVARSLHAHSVIALALGGLIYILAVTGTLSVFNHDIQRWEQPNVPEMKIISPEAAALAATTVFESEETPTTHLYINFPQPDLPRTVITTDTQAFFAAADGSIAGKENFPWTQFLLDLHYYLHLPQILGLTVVGALGAFLLAMSLSGFLAHPRIFRDAFTVRRGKGRVSLTDLHNRLSVWTAPFHISNALTGAILGLASIMAFSIAATTYDGDTGKVFNPIFGSEPAPDDTPALLGEIEAPLAYVQDNFPDKPPTYFIMHDPTTAGQNSTVILKHSDRLIFGEYYQFDSAGNYQGNVGISDGTIGQQIIGSVYNVHFGNWGGLPVKLAYLVFGAALSLIIASGLRIYFARKRDRGEALPRLEALWEAVVWGTPAILSLTLIMAFLGAEAWLVPVFWIGLLAIMLISFITLSSLTARLALKATTMVFLAGTLAAYISVFPSYLTSAASLGVTISVTLIIVAIGLTLRFDQPLIQQRRQARTTLTPAE